MKKSIILIAIIVVVSGFLIMANLKSPKNTNTNELTEKVVEGNLLEYEVIREAEIINSISTTLSIKISVPDNSSPEDIDYTMTHVINEKKLEWRYNISVWAYEETKKDTNEYAGKKSYLVE